MKIILSKNNHYIRLTDERMNHVIKNHPEMNGEENNIINTIENPDIIFEGNFNELLAAKFYNKTPVSENKYLVVIYKEIENDDGFILTAYFTRRLNNRRKIIWKH
jgi:hypothetical protein